MPKAKPDQVIVHRIELQETERATLEAALAGRFVTNAAHAGAALLSGVGSALAPFSGVLSAMAAVWIADRTWDELKERVLDPIVDSIREPHIDRYAGDYSMIVAWLNAQYSNQGWGFLQTDNSSREAYMGSAEFATTMWRNGGVNHPTLGWFTGAEGHGGETYRDFESAYVRGVMPGWLVDRFDSFIYTMKQNTAGDKSKKTPAEWWVQFYPYAEFENEIIWHAKNR
jgi:hypothetical protein